MGYYDLNGSGELSTYSALIGEHGRGTFTQTGGTHTSTALSVAKYSQSNGTYGRSGSGVFKATGGIATIAETVNIGMTSTTPSQPTAALIFPTGSSAPPRFTSPLGAAMARP